ncbi:MAG: TRAP transporter TatT component family protein [Desulfobaccales bacterium]
MKNSLIGLVAAVALLLAASGGQAAAPDKMARADALMKSPALDYQQARQALALYEELLPGSPPLWVRLARTCFVLGDMADDASRAGYYEKGLTYAEKLLAQQPNEAAGHYWKALNLSGLADVNRLRGLKLLPQIMDELKRSLALDETYDQAGAHRVLGRIYFEAPGWPISVGDRKKSLEQLTAAVRLAPDNSTNHLYLAETLLAMGEKAQARGELEKALQARRYAISPQGLEEDHRKARALLKEMENS